MGSGLTQTDIYNMVLDRLTQETVLSPSDDTAITRWLNRNYAQQRDVLLSRHPWNFAVTRAQLAALDSTPSFEWLYHYNLPSDCLRLLQITTDGYRDSPEVPHVVESGKILTDKSGPLRVRYIRRVTVETQFTNVFADVLAEVLAARMAHWMTGKASYAKFMREELPAIIANAQLLDSLEGTPEPPDDSDVINAR
jgi:hypothetical protein